MQPVVITPGQLSLAVGVYVTLARLHWPGSVVRITSAGQLTFGNSWSRTVTLNQQVRPLPLVSVALHTTKLAPFAKVDPLGGVQLTLTGPQLSVAVGA